MWGWIGTVVIIGVGISLIPDRDDRLLAFFVAAAAFWLYWQKNTKESSPSIMFWLSIIGVLIVGGGLRGCTKYGNSYSDCTSVGRYSEYQECR